MARHDDARDTTTPRSEFMGLVGSHPSMQRVFNLIRKVGPSQSAVLITGESGTGKELVARALHELSGQKSRNFVPVHCGAIPEELLESELFGHVKGAFTGALAARTGRFQLANGGSIFLDEIGEMSPRFQVKLLRVLEDGSFEPVGATSTLHTDVRVIAATHRDLRTMAKEGGFREDLLYRLDVVEIHLPALRERREDIPQIAEHFLTKLRETRGIPRFELAPETRRKLMAYDWPGNVRELRNVLERAAVLAENPGVIVPADLPDWIAAAAGAETPLPATSRDFVSPWDFGAEGTDFYKEMENFERRMIGRALQLAGGSKREAARLLQVNRTTLLEKLKRRGWEMRGGSLEPVEAPAATPDAWQGLRRGQASFQPGQAALELQKPIAVTGS
ncbi:MAG: sigma-54 dependent transcriptional regulator [Candidatus Binatia bacterium]|nr:sigma-54 dependent transcriptional regulator [Candidatus Binatia bacterium]